ncbi:MAG: ATP synthase F1 subunit delta [Candidatus Marinimicrobia bacterium]|nr:ATP synthase F1 subunit delta [Candidatus Neomarinimicrobiota bacterium]
MKNNREVKKYTGAVFAVAEKSGRLSEVSQHLNTLLKVYKASPELRLFLQSQRIPFENKSNILQVVLKDVLSEFGFELLFRLLNDGRIQILEEIIKRVQFLIDSKSGALKVKVSTTSPLNDNELNDLALGIEKQLEKKIEMEAVVDPDILGGVKFRIGNTIIDGSIATRLQKLGNSLYLK